MSPGHTQQEITVSATASHEQSIEPLCIFLLSEFEEEVETRFFLSFSALQCCGVCLGDDPFASFDFELSYITVSPLGVPQQVIAVNKQFPGPVINVTTNYNVAVNVRNKLDENLLITWSGIQMRRASWQDGVLGTNCPIPPKWNWTYQFQVKDQIGSFFYYPSLGMQRASGGFGPLIINNRAVVPLPFNTPDGDIVIMIGDWYTRNHTALRKALDDGRELGMPDGVLINGKGPYRYNDTLVPDKIEYATINVEPVSTSLNFRIQNHNLLLAETEGYYTSQQNYTSLDIHVGQSYSFLVTMDQNASSDYYIVASARFVNESLWQRVTGVAVLHYSNSKGPINGTDVYVLKSYPPTTINKARRAAYNGISFYKPDMPFRLADVYHVKGQYKLDFPSKPLNRTPVVDRSIINATYKGFIEVIVQNNDTVMQTFHVDEWVMVSGLRTTEVFPLGWTAVYVYLDNVGVWNLRTENLDRWYLGQETYMRIINPEDIANKTELPVPDNVLYCGALKRMQKPQKITSSSPQLAYSKLVVVLLVIFSTLVSGLR
ncbi:monocopper oxidase-like protein sks1 [Phtheirospermum japonicum]|uniref:Monocopper oxidase-like protein sks1 n=1 Tax=Phtheirospermum japonicum TaxID=374723 RepID=A0A830BV47_9LAMI|nr:monocopper oxidase-like protein sks1 [Phtheirospermum japonicum]